MVSAIRALVMVGAIGALVMVGAYMSICHGGCL